MLLPVVTALAVIAYGVVMIWPAERSTTFGSPDETGNRVFIAAQAEQGSFRIRTNLTSAELELFHPRSSTVQGSDLLPGSWIGFLQVGGWLERFGGWRLSFAFVPAISAIGLLALYRIFRRFWSRPWAWLGIGLVAAHPAWTTFQTSPMFHNGPFAAMLIVAGLGLLRLWERPTWRRAAVFGLAYGAALYFRPSEVIWSGPLIAVVVLALPRGWRWLLIAAAACAVVQLPWLLENQRLYGSMLRSAYAPDGLDTTNAGDAVSGWKKIFLPAGGRWSWHFWSSAWWYLFMLVPAWSAATVITVVTYFRRKFKQRIKILKLGLIMAGTLFLVIYYGSWDLYPAADAERVGPLASYARYWLPIYVAMSAGVVNLFRRFGAHRAWLAIVVATMLVSELTVSVWHPQAGLRARWQQQRQALDIRSAVFGATPSNAMVIAGQNDKIIWPDRLAAFSLPTAPQDWPILQRLASKRPVYLYAAVGEYRLTTLNSQMQASGLALTNAVSIGRDTLWRISPI